jgi:hypothetical protein
MNSDTEFLVIIGSHPMSADEFLPFADVAPFLPDAIVFGDHFGVMAFHTAFVKQAEFLWKADYEKLPERLQKCWALFLGLREDVRALALLVARGFPNQSYMVYRAVLEKMVTLLYLQVASEQVFNDYMQYPLHKSFRKTQRDVRVQSKHGEVGYRSGTKVDLTQFPQMENAVKRFTAPSGKPHTHWDNTSLDKKVAEIKKSGLIDTAVLELLIAHIYDDASEAIHGTLYGCAFHLDIFEFVDASKPEPDWNERLGERLFTSSWMGATVMFQVLECVLGQTGQTELLEKGKVIDELIKERMKRAVEKPKGDKPVDN